MGTKTTVRALAIAMWLSATTLNADVITFTSLYSFSGGADGKYALGWLVQAADGYLYGTTKDGGVNGNVYKISTAGAFANVHSFNATDGKAPWAGLTVGSDGYLYGTTHDGQAGVTYGVAFKMTLAGAETVLRQFNTTTDGGYLAAGLVQASDGYFYGLTGGGVATPNGGIYRVNSAGSFSLMHVLTGNEGQGPQASLIQASDGCLYGVAYSTGSSGTGNGTIFKLTLGGTFSVLYTFSGSDGQHPTGALVQGPDGYLYGTTILGGASNKGVAYKISTNGVFSLIHTFTGGADGATPESALIVGNDGNFYGTTAAGGAAAKGNVFRMTPSGAVTEIYAFSGGADGNNPQGNLLQANDGKFYGTTRLGGTAGFGTVFKLAVAWSPLVSTESPTSVGWTNSTLNGTANPNGGTTSAYFAWGTTTNYGNTTPSLALGSGSSTLPVSAVLTNLLPGTTYHYRLVASNAGGTTNGADQTFTTHGVPTITSFSPTSGTNGTTVWVTGTGFYNVSAVRVGSTAADSFGYSDTQLSAVVSAAATTGPILITTPGGTAASPSDFTVIRRPSIAGVTPGSGTPGTTATISGTNLTGVTSVLFNGLAAGFTVDSDTQITASVPCYISTGYITLRNLAGGCASPNTFQALRGPVTITGTGQTELNQALCAGSSVTFSVDGVVELNATQVIAGDTTLDGTGHKVTLSGSNLVQVLAVNPGVHLTLVNLTIANGRATSGGAIFNNGGVVTITGCTFTNNAAVATTNLLSACGGAIYNTYHGKVVINNSTFVNNRAVGCAGTIGTTGVGAGVAGGYGTAASSGYGGAIFSAENELYVTNCTFYANQASGGQGGQGGTGGNGYYNGQYIVYGGYGGQGGPGGDAAGGNIYCLQGTGALVNVTLAAGGATPGPGGWPGNPGAYGPGTYGPGPNGSSYGGNVANAAAALAIQNTILDSPGQGGNGFGSVTDLGNNLCSDNTGGFTAASSRTNTNPQLGPLADNGGGSMTMALPPGSPAINAGASTGAPATDQRGLQRLAGGANDIGAFELQNVLYLSLRGAATVTNECRRSYSDPGVNASNIFGANLTGAVILGGSFDPTRAPMYGPGTYSITYSLTEGALSSSVSRTVRIVDTTPPWLSLSGPSPMTIECHTPFIDPGASANDIAYGPIPVQVTGNLDTNSPGDYTLTYTATDPAGNSAQATRQIAVRDTLAPTLTLLGANPLVLPMETSYAEPGATASDTCAGDLTASIILTNGITAGVPGNYVVTYTVRDASGNAAVATRAVSILLPVLGLSATNGQIRLTWPANTVGFELQQTTNVDSANWEATPVAPGKTNGFSTVTVPIAGRMFYRLKQIKP